MIGLKRGSVALLSHQEEWDKNAENVILELKQLFGNAAVDIQHVGSTAIHSIYAKPIIDIVIGLRNLNDISPYMQLLAEHGFIFRGEDVAGQMLFIMGDFEKDTRTHHIHAVKWGGTEWKNYINFRDYLNCHPDKEYQKHPIKEARTVAFIGCFLLFRERTASRLLIVMLCFGSAALTPIYREEKQLKKPPGSSVQKQDMGRFQLFPEPGEIPESVPGRWRSADGQ